MNIESHVGHEKPKRRKAPLTALQLAGAAIAAIATAQPAAADGFEPIEARARPADFLPGACSMALPRSGERRVELVIFGLPGAPAEALEAERISATAGPPSGWELRDIGSPSTECETLPRDGLPDLILYWSNAQPRKAWPDAYRHVPIPDRSGTFWRAVDPMLEAGDPASSFDSRHEPEEPGLQAHLETAGHLPPPTAGLGCWIL